MRAGGAQRLRLRRGGGMNLRSDINLKCHKFYELKDGE